MGGTVLATVTQLGGIFPVATWATLGGLAAYRFLTPDNKSGNNGDNNDHNPESKGKKSNIRKVVHMGKRMIGEIAKAAPITVLFHTVGIDALTL